MKKPIGIFTIILLLISLMPSRIFADESTYTVCSGVNDFYVNADYYGNTTRDTQYFEIVHAQSEVRGMFYLRTGNSGKAWFFISMDSFQYRTVENATPSTSALYNSNGISFYYYYRNLSMNGNSVIDSNIAVVSGTSSRDLVNIGLYYTFGEGAIAAAPEFGDLKNLGFYTKFVNSQQSNISQMALNKDVITWDQFQDTNGNDLNDINLRVDIQAATIDYEASTKSDLINQSLNDIVTGNWSELVSISPNVGTYEITWDQVAQQLWHSDNITIDFWNSLFNIYDSARGVFFKNGWIYRVRLRTADNSYVGQWQTVYNITSMPPADSDKVYTNYYVYNYTVPNEDTYEVIQNINNINNTENNWYQNDQPFSPETAGDNWLSKLIEAILSFLGQLIHDILGLFTFESFEIPDFESNKINIINNTGMFGESLQFTDQLKQAIEDVEYVEPVLTYPGLTIDNVQLIQPMTFNLNDYVQNEEIQDIRSLAYLVTDGFIYLSLVLLIKNKIMGVLKK